MRYIIIALLFVACSTEDVEAPKPEAQSVQSYDNNYSDSLINEIHNSIKYMSDVADLKNRIYENSISYYQTGEEKYREHANRYIDSVNKMIREYKEKHK
jgi:hypothetical protein